MNYNEVLDKCKSTLLSLPGGDRVLKYLEERDYFIAPASTKYHNACEEGLWKHSMHVVTYLLDITEKHKIQWKRPESPYIIGMLHDLCKVGFYKISQRNAKVKNEITGKEEWKTVPYYEVDDTIPLGHGSKSVILIQQLGLKLTMQEVYCILYHMGPFGDTEYQRNFSKAVSKCPEILFVSLADQLSSLYEDNLYKLPEKGDNNDEERCN